jgi:hypothetical protein
MKPTALAKLEECYPLDGTFKQEEAVAGYEAAQLENIHLQLIMASWRKKWNGCKMTMGLFFLMRGVLNLKHLTLIEWCCPASHSFQAGAQHKGCP